MARFIAFGILRRDFQLLSSDEDRDIVVEAAQKAVADGLVPEAFVLSVEDYFANGIGPAHVPQHNRPEVAPAPLRLSPHGTSLTRSSFVGGESLHDVADGVDPSKSPNQVSGRTPVAQPAEGDPAE